MKLLDVVVWPMVLLGLSPFLLVALAIAAVVVAVTVALIRWDRKKAEARRRENQGLERRSRDDKEEKP